MHHGGIKCLRGLLILHPALGRRVQVLRVDESLLAFRNGRPGYGYDSILGHDSERRESEEKSEITVALAENSVTAIISPEWASTKAS